jgi:hypothetical protein
MVLRSVPKCNATPGGGAVATGCAGILPKQSETPKENKNRREAGKRETMKNTLIACAVAFPVLLGCQQKPDQEAMAECWNDAAKSQLTKMAKQNIAEKIGTLLKAGGETVDADVKGRIDASLEVSASNFYVESIDRVADSVHCGAQVAMKYTKEGGKVLSADGAFVDFNIYRGETGKMYSIPTTLPLAQLVSEATGAM